MPYDSVALPTRTAGVLYADNVLMPAAEGDLSTILQPEQSPPPVLYGVSLLAHINFSCVGNIGSNTAYVVLQTSFSGSNWLDLAWCTTSIISGTASFWMATSRYNTNSMQQTRVAGTAPSPVNGNNAFPLGGLIRFVGKSTVGFATSSSSQSLTPGTVPGVYANVKYKLDVHL